MDLNSNKCHLESWNQNEVSWVGVVATETYEHCVKRSVILHLELTPPSHIPINEEQRKGKKSQDWYWNIALLRWHMVLQGIINIPETNGESITPTGGTMKKKSETFLPNGAKPNRWQQKRVLLLDLILQKRLWHSRTQSSSTNACFVWSKSCVQKQKGWEYMYKLI